MKKQLFLLLSFVLLNAVLTGQNANLLVFSDEEPFILLVNGVAQNTNPQTNVKATGVGPNLRVRVKFANAALPALDKTFPVEDNTETTLRVKRDKKGEWKLAYFGSVPVGQSNQNANASQPTYNTASSSGSAGESGNNTFQQNAQVNGGNTTITSSTTTVTQGNPNQQNASVNVNVGGMGINMNVSGMDNSSTMSSTSSTTVTTTQTQSQSSSYGQGNSNVQSSAGHNSNNVQSSGKAGCQVAMSQANFAKMKESVEAKPFSDTKMSTAKIATKNACLNVGQVKEICKLFSMDEDKLEYAKYAYTYCIEKSNYYQVSEVFSFSSTTDEFNKFLEQ
jgi:hypothetical protein